MRTPAASCTFLLLAWSLTASPDAAGAQDPEEEDSSFEFGLDADLEFAHERQAGKSASEFTFDEIGIVLGQDWWELETGIKYKSSGGRGLLVEEASLRLGPTDDTPWFVGVGRTVVPFGRYDTRFIEDPMTVLVGETVDDAIMLGHRGDQLEITAGSYRGEFDGDGDLDFVLNVMSSAREGWQFGVSWSSDVGESVELRELRRELLEEGPPAAGSTKRVGGLAAFFVRETGRHLVEVEYVTALESFPPGALADEALRPSAWNLELAGRLVARWQLALRVEGSRDIPDSPALQYGTAVSWTLSENAVMTAEYLRGSFDGDGPDLDLLGLKFALEY